MIKLQRFTDLFNKFNEARLLRHVRFAIKYVPSDYIFKLKKAGISFISQTLYGDTYSVKYEMDHRPNVSFSFEKNDPFKTLVAVVGGNIIELPAKLKSKVISRLKWEREKFSDDEPSGNYFCG